MNWLDVLRAYLRSIWHGQLPFGLALCLFIFVAAVGPVLVFVVLMTVLCLIECSALPWLGIMAIPALLIVVLPLLVIIGVGAFRASRRLHDLLRPTAQFVILTSVFWVPLSYTTTFNFLLSKL